MAEHIESICRLCFHSYVCEQFNEHRDSNNEKCHFFNDHFVPAADVAPVVHGRWIVKSATDCFCSECKTQGSPQWKGCPVCLARMDGDS